MANFLETKSVTKVYKTGTGATRAVDGVLIVVKSGEFVAPVGPSGSGKTSLLAMLAALLKPNEGTINIDGQDSAKRGDRRALIFAAGKSDLPFRRITSFRTSPRWRMWR